MNPNDDIRRGDATVDDADLLALFAKRRPDAAAFARGVQQRLAERERRAAAPTARAASHLPLDVTPLTGAAWTFLTTPVMLLTLAGAALLAALRSLRTTLASGARRETNVPVDRSAAVELQLGIWGLALLCASARLVVGGAATDLLLLVLLGASFLLVLAVRRAASRTGIDRATVGVVAATSLEAILLASLFLAPDAEANLPLWHWRVFALLGVAMFAVLPAAPKATAGALVTLALFAGLHGLLGAVPEREPTLDDLAAAVAATAPDPLLTTAADVVPLVVALQDHGRPSALDAAFDRALREARNSDRLAPLSLTAELRLGRIDAAEWRRIATIGSHPSTLDRLLRGTEPLRPYDFQEYEIVMLVAARELDATIRQRLVDRVLAGLDAAPLPLQATLIAARWLDHLGRGDVVDERRVAWHELLVRHQHRDEPDAGGFRAVLGIPGSNRQATRDAVALMARIGVPTDLDHRALRRHLVRASRHFAALDPATAVHVLGAHVDRLTLDRLVGPPTRSLGELLRDERAFLVLIGFALLCVIAVWSAPKAIAPSAGAMP